MRSHIPIGKPLNESLSRNEVIPLSQWDLVRLRSGNEDNHPHAKRMFEYVMRNFVQRSHIALVMNCSWVKPNMIGETFLQIMSTLKPISEEDRRRRLGKSIRRKEFSLLKHKMEIVTGLKDVCSGLCRGCPYEPRCLNIVHPSLPSLDSDNLSTKVDLITISNIGIIPFDYLIVYPFAQYDSKQKVSLEAAHHSFLLKEYRMHRFFKRFKYDAIVHIDRPQRDDNIPQLFRYLELPVFELPSIQCCAEIASWSQPELLTRNLFFSLPFKSELWEVVHGLVHGDLISQDRWRYRRLSPWDFSTLHRSIRGRQRGKTVENKPTF